METMTHPVVLNIPNTLAFDFDGVIHNYTGWNNGVLNRPIRGAVEGWYKLHAHGYNPVIFTCRDDHDNMREWLHKYFDFERRIGHFYEPIITNVKPIAIAYVDDRALRFTNWEDIRKYFC